MQLKENVAKISMMHWGWKKKKKKKEETNALHNGLNESFGFISDTSLKIVGRESVIHIYIWGGVGGVGGGVIRTRQKQQIFGVIPFAELRNDSSTTAKLSKRTKNEVKC